MIGKLESKSTSDGLRTTKALSAMTTNPNRSNLPKLPSITTFTWMHSRVKKMTLCLPARTQSKKRTCCQARSKPTLSSPADAQEKTDCPRAGKTSQAKTRPVKQRRSSKIPKLSQTTLLTCSHRSLTSRAMSMKNMKMKLNPASQHFLVKHQAETFWTHTRSHFNRQKSRNSPAKVLLSRKAS